MVKELYKERLFGYRQGLGTRNPKPKTLSPKYPKPYTLNPIP